MSQDEIRIWNRESFTKRITQNKHTRFALVPTLIRKLPHLSPGIELSQHGYD